MLKLAITSIIVGLLAVLGAPQGRTITVNAGGSFQAALDSSQTGDTIILQADAAFRAGSQPFIVSKSGITIKSSTTLPNRRMALADRALMPHVVATGPLGTIKLAVGVRDVVFSGIDFTNVSDGSAAQHCNSIIALDASPDPKLSGDNITFDRVLIHPQEDGTTTYFRTASRGIFANAGAVKFVNSYIGGFTGFYAHDRRQVIDAVGFASVVGGPFTIENSTIQAGFNPIFLGGGDPGGPPNHTATVSSGTLTQATLSSLTDLRVGDKIAIEVGATAGDQFACGTVTAISGNTITYTQLVRNEGGEGYVVSSRLPQAGGQARWRGYTIRGFYVSRSTISIDKVAAQVVLSNSGSKPKAYAEIKLLEDGLFDACIFEGWPTGIAITLRNQNGFSPWSNVKDVLVRNSFFKEFSSQIIQLFSGDRLSETGSNIRFENVLLDGPIQNALAGTFPSVAYTSFGSGVVFDHVTVLNKQDVRGGPMMIGLAVAGVTIRNSIMYFNTYGTQCAVTGNAFASCWPGFQEQGNIVVNNDSDCEWITGTKGNFPRSFCVASLTLDNYRLPSGHPLKGKASDGKDPGVDMDALNAALGGAPPQPTPSQTPLPSPSQTPMPSPSVSPLPTPLPGMRMANGYVKVNGEYFNGNSTVMVAAEGRIVQEFAQKPGGYFEFLSVPVGALLSAVADGFNFPSQVIDSQSPYFIINGTVRVSTPSPTPSVPQPSPSPLPSPSPSPTVPVPSPTPTPPLCSPLVVEWTRFTWSTLNNAQKDTLMIKLATDGYQSCFPSGNFIYCSRLKP